MNQNNKIILKLDTSQYKSTTVELIMGTKSDKIVRVSENWASQTLLPVVVEILEKNEVKLHHINQVEVNTGPGSFTGLRVGAAVANLLGWYLNIPVNGKIGPAVPIY